MLSAKLQSVAGEFLGSDPIVDQLNIPANDCSREALAQLSESRQRGIVVTKGDRCLGYAAIRAMPMRVECNTYIRIREWEIRPVKILEASHERVGLGRLLVSLLAYDCIVAEASPNHVLRIMLGTGAEMMASSIALRCGFRDDGSGRMVLGAESLPELSRYLFDSLSDGTTLRVAGRYGQIEIDASDYRSFSSARLEVMRHYATSPVRVSA